MASYRVVNGQKVLVSATQRPAPLTPASASIEQVEPVQMSAAVEEKPLAGLAPANHQDVVTEEPSNGG